MKFQPASVLTLFCVEVKMLHHHQSYRSLNYWLLPLYKCLCHRLPDVKLSEGLLSSTYTLLKCKLVGLSELMPLNSAMPEVLHDLHSLLRT